MIRVTVETVEHQYHSMTVVGHAETGESGFDLVCAGVSSILTGALNAFDEMDDDAHLIMSDEPLIYIELKSKNQLNQKLFEFMLIQLKTVEAAHPQDIEIHEKEVRS